MTLPHTFVNSQVSDAAQVNENFSALETEINTLQAELAQPAGASLIFTLQRSRTLRVLTCS